MPLDRQSHPVGLEEEGKEEEKRRQGGGGCVCEKERANGLCVFGPGSDGKRTGGGGVGA